MIAYLEKYNKLPQELRDKMSDRAVVEAIDKLEKKHNISLAKIIIEIMIKEINLDALGKNLIVLGLNPAQAEELVRELKMQVFSGVLDYLGVSRDKKEIKQNGLPAEIAGGKEKNQPSGAGQINSLEKINQNAATGASFFFSSDDEQEIREISKKIIGESSSPADSAQVEAKTDKIIELANINFGSESILERFRQIIKTYLKGIRDRISTKQTLIKHFDSGGLSFDEESADKLLRLADEISRNFASVPYLAQKTAELKKTVIRDYEYDLSKELKNRDVKSLLEKIDISHEIAPPHPVLAAAAVKAILPGESKKAEKPASMLNRLKNKILQQDYSSGKKIEEKNKEPERESKTIIKNVASAPASSIVSVPVQKEKLGKIKMEDVKFIPKAFGPVEELGYMDLPSFRRLGKMPEDMAKKIKEKINLLEEDSYLKRLEGIKAWRNNPINKICLEMGRASIGGGKPISDIIKERSAGGQECLTDEEFSAIMDLNKELRF